MSNVAEKKEFTMVQVLALWKHKAKSGSEYFSGKDDAGNQFTGFYNTNKKNPKEPDIRIYKNGEEGKTEKDVFLSLWCNVSKNGKKYLSGKLDGKRVIGFIRKTDNEKQPYVSVYYSEDTQEQSRAAEDKKSEEVPF